MVSVTAWRAYWVLISIASVAWIGYALTHRGGLTDLASEPLWLAVLVLPLLGAGINLVLVSREHEVVCAREAAQHRWFAMIVGRGYPAWTFRATGIFLILLSGLVAVAAVLSIQAIR